MGETRCVSLGYLGSQEYFWDVATSKIYYICICNYVTLCSPMEIYLMYWGSPMS